jgi:hypothetical protein
MLFVFIKLFKNSKNKFATTECNLLVNLSTAFSGGNGNNASITFVLDAFCQVVFDETLNRASGRTWVYSEILGQFSHAT